MSGPTELMQYTIKKWIMEETATGVVVTLVLGRKILNEILTTYLPTSLLIIIVHSTNYYKDFFFEAIVTVNLTGNVLKWFKLVGNKVNFNCVKNLLKSHRFYASATKHLGIGMLDGRLVSTQISKKLPHTRDVARRRATQLDYF